MNVVTSPICDFAKAATKGAGPAATGRERSIAKLAFALAEHACWLNPDDYTGMLEFADYARDDPTLARTVMLSDVYAPESLVK